VYALQYVPLNIIDTSDVYGTGSKTPVIQSVTCMFRHNVHLTVCHRMNMYYQHYQIECLQLYNCSILTSVFNTLQLFI